MKELENRLIENSKNDILKKPLKGKELAKYVEDHREEFQDNGDALCVEAGYGEYSTDGNPKCDFQPFVKELGKAMNLES